MSFRSTVGLFIYRARLGRAVPILGPYWATRALLGPLPAAALDQSSVSIQLRKLSNFKYIDGASRI